MASLVSKSRKKDVKMHFLEQIKIYFFNFSFYQKVLKEGMVMFLSENVNIFYFFI